MDHGAGQPLHRGPSKFHEGLIDDLIEFARSEFELDQPDEQGVSKRATLLDVERQTGETPKALLEARQQPEGTEFVWQVFNELSMTRGIGMAGAQPITYLELDAYQRVSGLTLTAFELQAIRELDITFLGVVRGKPKPKGVPGG